MNLVDRTRWCTECMWVSGRVEATHVVNCNDEPQMQRFACDHHAKQYKVKQTMHDYWEAFDHLMMVSALKRDD